MTTALSTALTREQQLAYDKMPLALQKKADRAVSVLRGMIKSSVMSRHEMGELVREIHGDETKYGESAVQTLASVMGEKAVTLWSCRALAQTYTKIQLEKLLEKSSRAGHMLQWSHIRHLISVEDASVRKQLESAAVEKKMTSEDLGLRIQKILGKRKQTGRAHLAPRSPAQAMGQINKLTNQLVSQASAWNEAVFTHYDNAGADQLGADDVKEIEALHTNIVQGRKELQKLEDHSAKTLATAKQRAKKGGAKAASNGHAGNGSVKPRQKPNIAAMLGGRRRRKGAKGKAKAGARKTTKRRLQTA